MHRSASARLESWLADPERRPLVLRGARQVGKTWLVRHLARSAARNLVELHHFMYDKALDRAVRCDANPPSRMTVDVATTQGQSVRYELISVPPYLCWNLDAILAVA